jgi:hypothetical protein
MLKRIPADPMMPKMPKRIPNPNPVANPVDFSKRMVLGLPEDL